MMGTNIDMFQLWISLCPDIARANEILEVLGQFGKRSFWIAISCWYMSKSLFQLFLKLLHIYC